MDKTKMHDQPNEEGNQPSTAPAQPAADGAPVTEVVVPPAPPTPPGA